MIVNLTEEEMQAFREQFASDTPPGRMWRRIHDHGQAKGGQTLQILRAVFGHVWGDPVLRQPLDAASFLGISEAEASRVLNETPMGEAEKQ
jgi:hypothetical protein